MSDPLEDGIIFFNAGLYFEAHEVWEDLWRPAYGPDRTFYQGLIQAAVGMHHLARGNLNGASSQLQKALSKLEKYPDTFRHIDNEKLVEQLRSVLDSKALRPVQITKV
jgi:predicted metal-dependent hydrolase